MTLKRKLPAAGITELIFFPLLFIIALILAFNLNFTGFRTKGPPEIYSDKADYYVYLPATFIYGWDVDKFPKGSDSITRGFTLDYKNHKLIIKTTCGVAILVSPFFLAAHFIAVHWDLEPDGFSDIYQKMSVIPGVFYLVLGLFFLKRFLDHYFRGFIPFITVLLVFAGTNLYFYAMDDCLMSHVYSFFLFSLFLYLLKRFLTGQHRSFRIFIGLSVVFTFAVLIRPTNILLLSWMAFLDVRTRKEFTGRILLFLQPRYVATLLIAGFLVFLPQLFYWKYLSGSFMYYSYPGESFINWKNPRIIEIWFAPLNGLFLYSPLVLFFIGGIVYMSIKKIPNGVFTGIFFLLVSYLFSSWHAWFFGGSFGYRPFVEFYSLLALPFAYFLFFILNYRNLFIRSAVIILMLLSAYFTLKLIYNYRWNTSSTWAWDDFMKKLDIAHVYKWPGETYTFVEDFENPALATIAPQRDCVHSPTLAGYISDKCLFSDRYTFPMPDILKNPLRKVTISLWVNPDSDSLSGAVFVTSVEDWQHNRNYYKILRADDFATKPHEWARMTGTVTIPEWIDQSANYIIFNIWNPEEKKMIYIDDVRLKFE